MNNAKKAKKLPSLSKLRKLADRLWSLKVKIAYGSKCAICGDVENLNSHHIEPRTSNAVLRWEPLNGISLCVTHHKYGKDAAHKSTIFFYEFLRDQAPKVIEYIRPLRGIDTKANKVSREQMDIVLAALWTAISQEDADVWSLSKDDFNTKWMLARQEMHLTVWERTHLESLKPQSPTWPVS